MDAVLMICLAIWL